MRLEYCTQYTLLLRWVVFSLIFFFLSVPVSRWINSSVGYCTSCRFGNTWRTQILPCLSVKSEPVSAGFGGKCPTLTNSSTMMIFRAKRWCPTTLLIRCNVSGCFRLFCSSIKMWFFGQTYSLQKLTRRQQYFGGVGTFCLDNVHAWQCYCE